ncbi:type II toxin-antitoxin system RelE/ParE family toxin [Emcibacter sp. SYSU 3D8]|uniref:type II toxin-antitoxin system RelE/ParE family toxin n=1 Tax=Emcibacter sp. SYSU 3D8 TaxID=3133969 RepID=UPI0031FF3152
MPSFQLTIEAEADLRDIYRQSRKRWGKPQTALYLNNLDEVFHDLASHPDRGRTRHDLRPGVRSRLSGKHVVFYRTEGDHVSILRILHQAQDAFQAFGRR